MALNLNDFVHVNNVIINTGNILSLNDITKKTIQNPSDELIEAINITIKGYQNGQTPSQPDQPLIISRPNDDTVLKISEHDSSDLKFGFKIFLTSDDPVHLIDSIEKALITLNVTSVNNVIIAFVDKKTNIGEIKSIWSALEDYVLINKINKIGIADVEEEIFRSLFDWSSVKPSIIQINLATCCVVPPTLQSFCKEHEIQLLTHSDPTDILPEASLDVVLGKEFFLKWVVRFLVHIKCRGVLTTKGYLLSLGK